MFDLNDNFFKDKLGIRSREAYFETNAEHELALHPGVVERTAQGANSYHFGGHGDILAALLARGGRLSFRDSDIRNDAVEGRAFALALADNRLVGNGDRYLEYRRESFNALLRQIIAKIKEQDPRHRDIDTVAELQAAIADGRFAAAEAELGRTRTLVSVALSDTNEFEVAVEEFFDGALRTLTTIDGGQFGIALGSVLGQRVTSNPFGQIVASAALKTILGAFGEALDPGANSTSILGHGIEGLVDNFGDNVVSGAIGAVSSYVTAELLKALHIDGTIGEALNSVGSAVLNKILTNIVVQNATTPQQIFNGINPMMLANTIGSFIGSKLAAEVHTFTSVGGQIGAAAGAAYGSWAAGQAITALGITNPIVAVAVVAVAVFVTTLIGGSIGSIFGGTPRSGADTAWDEETGQFVAANAYARKGGSKEAAVSLATTVAGNLNAVLDASGATLLDPESVQAGNYGMRTKNYVYRPTSTSDKDAITARFEGKDGATQLVGHGTYLALNTMIGKLAGGDIYVKRAIAASLAFANGNPYSDAAGAAGQFDFVGLMGDVTVARDYGLFLAQRDLIGAAVAADPETGFAAGWLITLTRAVELGLNRRSYTDWVGGFGTFFDEAVDGVVDGVSISAAQVEAQMDSVIGARVWAVYDSNKVLIGYSDDTIDANSQTRIAGTAGSDTIRLGTNNLPAPANGENVGLTVGGVLHNGAEALKIDVAALILAGDGDDYVHASDRGDSVLGGAGNDTLYGGRLDDWLLGGDGNDTINAGSTVAGTLGGDGNYLDGGAGDDLLIGREGSDWLEGGDGTDTLEGGDGGDILGGGAGHGDILRGGRGDDQYIFRIGDVGSADIAHADVVRDESGLTVQAVIAQSYNKLTSSQIQARVAEALSGALFRNGRGLDNWHGGGTQVTANGIAAGGEDSLVLGAGITIGDVKILKSADSKDLIIELWPDGLFAGDRVVLKDWFSSFNKVETLRFADGNEIRIADFDTFVLGTGASETIIGTQGNDFVHAGAGNDLVYLLSGNDFGNGGLGNDSVSGDSGNDIVVGTDGDDMLLGGSGTDMVSGGRGADAVHGDAGDDVVAGGAGDDELIGGAGNDVFKFARGDGRDTIIDELSNEWVTIWISGEGAAIDQAGTGYAVLPDGSMVHKTNGVVDQTLFDASTGIWSVRSRYSIESGILDIHKPANADAIVTSSGADSLEFGIGIDINDIQFQTAVNGRDLIIGIEGSNAHGASLAGLSDQIILKEWVSNPAARGSIETFSFFNTGAVDVAATELKGGSDGDDTLTGGSGKAWITGGAGDDTITGGALDDILNGNSGRDSLSGGAGADVLLGGMDDDKLTGGAGADILVGGQGIDIAAYDTAVTASLANPASNAGEAAGDSYDGVEGLRGSAFADTLVGDFSENDLHGGQGDDLLQAGGGDDLYTFVRGDGVDTIFDAAGSGETVVVDNSGLLQTGYVATVRMVDRVGSNNQFERIVTHAASGAVIYRKEYSSLIEDGLDGGQLPTGFDPAAWADGYAPSGNGQAVSLVQAAPGGHDTILLEDSTAPGAAPTADLTIGLSDLDFALAGNNLEITLNTTTAGTTIAGGKIILQNFRNGATTDANSAIETLQFSDGSSVNLAGLRIDSSGAFLASSADSSAAPVDDFIFSNAATLVGQYGNDTLLGGAGDNALQGGDGNDMLVGGMGADSLQGGSGVDTVSYIGSDGTAASRSAGVTVDLNGYGAGIGTEAEGDSFDSVENVIGSQFQDTVTGNDSDNVLKGNRGDDTIVGGGGGTDGVSSGVGADVLIGDEGNDSLSGGVGEDNLDGGTGNDILWGGGDRDLLAGGDGDDILTGDNDGGTAVGGNLLRNEGFEDSGDAANDASTAYGLTTADLPFWTSTSANAEQLVTSASGLTGLTGTRALHLDNGAENRVSQTIANLTAGEVLDLRFNHALKIAGASGGVEVLWNGTVVRTVTSGSTALSAATATSLTAIEGVNKLEFRSLGTSDGAGSVIDAVFLGRATGGGDQLIGGAGQDRLDGSAGNDVLIGGDGDDTDTFIVTAGPISATRGAGLYGGVGDDLLDGGAGDDSLEGGAGHDKYLFSRGSGSDTVRVGGGHDELLFDKIRHDQLWLREVGADLEITAIGQGTVVLVKNWYSATDNQARRIVTSDRLLARSDVQALVAAMAAVSATVPTAWPAAPTQAFSNALAATWQVAADYSDRSAYTGTAADDSIMADPMLLGAAKFYALAGNDTLTGTAFNDEFHFGSETGYDLITGGAGFDTIIADVDNAMIGLVSTGSTPLSAIEKITANGKTGVSIRLSSSSAILDLTNVVVEGVIPILGSDSVDTITGSANDDTIHGAGGNDVVKGGLGNDLLRGEAGEDNLDGGEGIDTYDASGSAAGIGTITISSTGTTSHVVVGAVTSTDTLIGFENVIGSSSDETINGSIADNRLDGSAGDDMLNGGDGNDMLIGGLGADIVKGGAGGDTASYETQAAASAITSVYSGVTLNGVVVDLTGGSSADGTAPPASGGRGKQGDAAGDWFYQVENLTGSGFNDLLAGDVGANRLEGGAGDDLLYGVSGDDILAGGTGSDILYGGWGTNTAVFAGTFAEYGIVSGLTTTITGIGSRTEDGTDQLNNIHIVQFADVTISLGVDTNNPPVLGEPKMVDQSVDDSAPYNYQIPATSFIDLDISGNGNAIDAMELTATLADDSPLPGWLSFDPTNRTFTGWPPLEAAGTTLEIKVTGTDSGASVSDSFLLTITQARGQDILGSTEADDLYGSFRDETITGDDGDDRLIGFAGADLLHGGAGTDLVDYSYSPLAVVADLAAGTGVGGDAEGDQLSSIEKIKGSAYADALTGSIGQDDLRGGDGDDAIDGGAESDFLDGGAGADRLAGGAGSDTIYARTVDGGGLEDVVDGGAGVDELRLGADTSFENYLLWIDGSSYGAVLDLSSPNGRILSIENVVGTDHNDRIVGNAFSNILNGGWGVDSLSGGDGNDILEGGWGNDLLVGGAGADRLYGGDGADRAIYYGAVDLGAPVAAGVTVDLTEQSNNAGLAAGDVLISIEQVVGTDHADSLRGDDFDNVLWGGGGDDIIRGETGHDTLFGEDGNDRLYGGAGTNWLFGGAGTDTVYFAGPQSDYYIDYTNRRVYRFGDGAGTSDFYDSIEFLQFANGAPITTSPPPRANLPLANRFIADNFNVSIMIPSSAFYDPDGAPYDIYRGLVFTAALTSGEALPSWLSFNPSIKRFFYTAFGASIGSSLNIRITASDGTGSASSDFTVTVVQGIGAPIVGTDGNDLLTATFRSESIDGGAGVDRLVYSGSTEAVTVDLATGTASGGHAQGDTLVSIEDVTGSGFDDTLTGSDAANQLEGGGGNDTLHGGQGSDMLGGGEGDDILRGEDGNERLAGAGGADLLDGGAGADTAYYYHLDAWTLATTSVTVDLVTQSNNAGGALGDTFISVEDIVGTQAGDLLYGDADANTIDGREGDDTLEGRGGADVILGGAGNDTVIAVTVGEDSIDGGTGIDTVTFASGPTGQTILLASLANVENAVGTSLADTITGTTAANLIDGGAGNDTIQGGTGADTLIGGAGLDWLSYAASGIGTTFYTAGAIGGSIVNGSTVKAAEIRALNGVNIDIANNMAGGADAAGDVISGFENLKGSGFADLLRGSAENTSVEGEDGNDVIYGGAGNDELSGGTGDDYIFGQEGGDILCGDEGADRLFGAGEADDLFGGAGEDLLDAGDSGDYLDGGLGNDIMIGGGGADHYVVRRDGGSDTIYNYDTDAEDLEDALSYIGTVHYTDLWFSKATGTKDLVLTIIGEAGTATTIKDWFQNDTAGNWDAAEGFYVDGIVAHNRNVKDPVNVSGLLAVMSTVARPEHFDTLSAEVQARINDRWGFNQAPTITAATANPSVLAEHSGINLSNSITLTFTVNDDIAPTGVRLEAEMNGVLQAILPADIVKVSETVRMVTVRTNPDLHGAGNLKVRAVDPTDLASAWITIPITVTPVADGITLGANTTSFALNSGTTVPLLGLSAGLSDSDSEVFDYLYLDGLAVGTVVWSGLNSFTATAGNTSANIAGWNLGTLNLTAAAGSSADMTLRLRGRSRDGSAGSYVYSAETLGSNLTVTVNGAPNVPTVSVDGTSSFGENSAPVRIATLTRADPDGTIPTLVRQGVDAGYFQILNGNEVWTVANLNYETVNKSTLALSVAASDGTLTSAAWTRTITFVDLNEVPTALTVTPIAFNENVGAAPVADLAATDPDAAQTLVYSIVGGADAAKFTIVGAQLRLAAGVSLNYESGPAVVDIRVTDQGGLSYTRTGVQITSANLDEAPTAITVSPLAFNENVADAPVANLSATDDDTGQTFTYEIVGGIDAAKFTIVGAQLRLAAGVSLDYESGPAVVDIRVTDQGGLSYTRTGVPIAAANLNEAPTNLRDVNSTGGQGASGTVGAVAENAVAGPVGITLKATDQDTGTALTYGLASNPNNWFTINPATGVISVAAGQIVDYEDAAVVNGQISINVTVSDGVNPSLQNNNLKIAVTDVNETPSFVDGANDSASVSEASTESVYIATIETSDLDSGTFGTVGHTITINSGDTSKFRLVTIAPNVVQLWTKAGTVLDYDDPANRTHSLQLKVVDNAGANSIPIYQNFTVNVTAVQETPSIPNAFSADVYENSSGVLLTVGGSVDPEGEAITYAFAAGGNPGGLFGLTGAGVLSLNFAQDNENRHSAFAAGYADVSVVATTATGVSAIRTGRITLLNVNEAPGAPSQPGAVTMAENYAGLTGITFSGAVDPDGDYVTYVFADGSDVSGPWAMVGNQLRLRFEQDYEAQHGLSVQVYAFANGQRSASGVTATVNLINVDDNLPSAGGLAMQNGYSTTIVERSVTPQSSLVIARAQASDVDGDALIWSIVSGNVASTFTIDANGYISAPNGINYENFGSSNLGVDANVTVNLVVRAAQGNNSDRYVDQTLTLSIADLAENTSIYDGNDLPYNGFSAEMAYTEQLNEDYWYENFVVNGDGYYVQTRAFLAIFKDLNGDSYYNEGYEPVLTQYDQPYNNGNRPTTYTYLATGYRWVGTSWASQFVRELPPVVLDLDGDGEFAGTITASFDVDGDGVRDHVGWIAAGDAFLALDRNGDGKIDRGSELSFMADLPGARSDLEGLAAYDSNQDGMLDSADEKFGTFLVWRDSDQDGISTPAELRTLAGAGVGSISLARNANIAEAPGEANNVLLGTASFTRVDGSRGQVGDLTLRWQPGDPATVATPIPAGGSLAIDRYGNGVIDLTAEVIGPNLPLADFDSNRDGLITGEDKHYFDLRLWMDSNGNKRAELDELSGLDRAGLTAISTSPAAVAHAPPVPQPAQPPAPPAQSTPPAPPVQQPAQPAAPPAQSTPPAPPVQQPAQPPAPPAQSTPPEPPVPQPAPPAAPPVQSPERPPAPQSGTSGDPFTPAPKASGEIANAPVEPPVFAVERRTLDRRSGRFQLLAADERLAVGSGRSGGLGPRSEGIGAAPILSFGDRQVGLLAPVVLDLDGDGIELKRRKKSSARFDMDGNGIADDTGWIGKDDGFLVVDLNGDGRIAAAELSLLGLKADARSGLEALAALDSKRDGKIDSADDRFAEVKIWRDRNGNGVTEAGELASLSEHGITSISLAAQTSNHEADAGRNMVVAMSSFTREDGSTGSLGAAALAFKPSGPTASQAERGGLEGNAAHLSALRAGLDGRESSPYFAAREGRNLFDLVDSQREAQTGEAGEAAAQGTASAVPADPLADARIALMVQDMASFGARTGESDWRRDGGVQLRYDYFAA